MFRSFLTRCLLSLVLLQWALTYADYADDILAAVKTHYNEEADEGYVINFTDVSINEYIRFISKILGVNFIFNESELNFNVTIVSEEPISGKNVLSALIQILRIHNLHLVEQNNNLLITSNPDVKEIPVVIADEIPDSAERKAGLITRIFRVKNTSANAVAEILRPMLSASALIEVMSGTNQLIISDVITNIDKIAELLLSLDSPTAPLDLDSYQCRQSTPEQIIPLAEQILEPFKKGKTLTLVSQEETNTIFIVGTEGLIERALSVLEDLDIPSIVVEGEVAPVAKKDKVFIYQVKNRSADYLLDVIHQVTKEMQKAETFSPKLLEAFESVKWVKGTNALVFIGTEATFSIIQSLLENVDIAPTTKAVTSYYIYSVGEIDEKPIENWLKAMAKDLAETPNPDTALIDVIRHMKWFKETNSFLFLGNGEALERLKEILSSTTFTKEFPVSIDAPQFWIYHPRYKRGVEIENHIKEIAENLKKAGLTNPDLLNTLNVMRYVSTTNSLIFIGNAETLKEVKFLIESIEKGEKEVAVTRAKQTSFFIYKPQARSPEEIEISLKEIAKDLKASGLADPDLLFSISTLHFVESTQSLLFTGTPDSLKKIQDLLQTIDIAEALRVLIQKCGSKTFLIYKPHNVRPEKIVSSLKVLASDLKKSDQFDRCFLEALQSVKVIKETHSLLFSGDEKSLKQVEDVIKKFDVPTPVTKKRKEVVKEKKEAVKERKEAVKEKKVVVEERITPPSNFFLYTPKYQNGIELIVMLEDFRDNLMEIGVVDEPLFDSIAHLKWVEKSQAILISGTKEAISRIEELLDRFDVPIIGEGGTTIQTIEATSFLVYKLQYNHGAAIQGALQKIAKELATKDAATNKAILNAIHSIQWIKVTNSLIGTGQHHALEKIKELIRILDIPLKQVFMEVLVIETSLKNTQEFGLQWGGKIQYLDKFAGAYGNFPDSGKSSNFKLNDLSAKGDPKLRTPMAGDVPFTSGFDLGIIGDILFHRGRSFISLGSLFNALQTDSDTVILLNPKIITQDNNNSTLFVGKNIPFVGSQVSNTQSGNSNIMTTTNLEYRDIGLSLSITPTLSTSDIVTLDISTDISDVITQQPLGNTGVEGITSTHTSMNTRVTIPNKHFLILSGMLRDKKDHVRVQIPCLGGLPLIGAAFSKNNRGDEKNNILIFLKPHIINSFEEYRTLTEDKEVLLKEEAGPEIIAEEIEAGLEWIKSPED